MERDVRIDRFSVWGVGFAGGLRGIRGVPVGGAGVGRGGAGRARTVHIARGREADQPRVPPLARDREARVIDARRQVRHRVLGS